MSETAPTPPPGYPKGDGPITVSVVRTVNPERSAEAIAWARAGQELMSAKPGYLGSGWVRPDPASPEWHMLFRFANAATLKAWEDSPEREWWVESALGVVTHHDYELRTGIEGWFDTPAETTVVPPSRVIPPRWKQMTGIFIVFYPLSLVMNWLVAPLLGEWPLALRVLVTVLIMSPLMTYLFLPWVTRALRPWLQKKPKPKAARGR